MIDASLAAIKEYLEAESISCSIETEEDEAPVEFLAIDMGEDEQGYQQTVQIFRTEKALIQAKGSETAPKPALFLHFRYIIPFRFEPEAVNDIARFLLLINKTLEFPGFGMSEVDQVIYYRHDLYCGFGQLNEDVLKGILGYLLFVVDSFTPKLQQLAARKISFKDVVEEALGQS